jgi:2-polyprenyl-6-hydroxyphenyl methylase/3-demethylubiquinone-9 3-methyltransferase
MPGRSGDLGVEWRYDFGRNWSALAEGFEEDHVVRAGKDLQRLVGDIAGRTFLDLGCGSGLHSVAALRLGASSVHAIDYDPRCVEVARATLRRFAPDGCWRVEQADLLARQTLPNQRFDLVYSWGVLHHTGDMWSAIRNSAALVASRGSLAIAIYVRTPLCGVWRFEKQLYSKYKWLRPAIKLPFIAALLLARAIRHRDAVAYVRNYRRARGMEFMVDVDDWLGGFPYESASPEELKIFVEGLGFRLKQSFNTGRRLGILGSGCGEWQFEPADGSPP